MTTIERDPANAPDLDPGRNPVLIAGCGYVGMRLGVREVTDGRQVVATTRTGKRFSELAALGFEPCAADLDAGPTERLEAAASGAEVHYLVPPPGGGDGDPRAEHFLSSLGEARPRKIVLLSTTGVYGDCAGAWIDETAPLNPQTARAHRRCDAEARFRAWAGRHQVPLAVLRVAGIYGPGRLPRARLERGEPVLDPGESPYSNRIHADDLVQVCRAAARSRQGYRVYNVADGSPSNMSDYLFRVADALGVPRPPTLSRSEAERTLSAGMLSYLNESKRIDNTRLREELGVTLHFPDLDTGLRNAAGRAVPAGGPPELVVCINRRIDENKPSCAARGSEALALLLAAEIARRGLAAELREVYCLGRCEHGPNLRITPGGKTYRGVDGQAVEEIMKDLAAVCEAQARSR